MTRAYVWHDVFICIFTESGGRTRACDVIKSNHTTRETHNTHSCVWQCLFICVHNVFICVYLYREWWKDVCMWCTRVMSHNTKTQNTTACVRYNTCICVTWHAHVYESLQMVVEGCPSPPMWCTRVLSHHKNFNDVFMCMTWLMHVCDMMCSSVSYRDWWKEASMSCSWSDTAYTNTLHLAPAPICVHVYL